MMTLILATLLTMMIVVVITVLLSQYLCNRMEPGIVEPEMLTLLFHHVPTAHEITSLLGRRQL